MSKLKNAKTCNGCRLLESFKPKATCINGFNIERYKTVMGVIELYRPTEPCPKSTTYRQMIDAPYKRELEIDDEA